MERRNPNREALIGVKRGEETSEESRLAAASLKDYSKIKARFPTVRRPTPKRLLILTTMLVLVAGAVLLVGKEGHSDLKAMAQAYELCKVPENVHSLNPALFETCDEVKTNSIEQDDSARAFFPARKSNIIQGSNVTWYNEWWRNHQTISFPATPVKCSGTTRYMSHFLGSQTFVDLKYFCATKKYPFHRYLDVEKYTYFEGIHASTHNETQSTVAELRNCIITRGAGNKNAINCVFLPTSDCVVDKIVEFDDDWSRTREEVLCKGSKECLKELARPVPVEPSLQGAMKPNVSRLMLFLYARFVALAAPMRVAVEERVAHVMQDVKLPCVAVHVRRGDKLGECPDGNSGKKASCAFHKNLTEYLDVAVGFAQQMEGAGSIFVMSDDVHLLDGVDSAHGYPIVGMTGNTPGTIVDGVEDLVVLLASLQVGAHCNAVVGNSESEMSEMLVLHSCLHHKACPSVHSMNGTPLQAFDGVIVNGRPEAKV
jgi:hypothetical protein